MSMDTESDPPNYTVEELTRLIEDLKHEEPEVIFYIIFFPFPSYLAHFFLNSESPPCKKAVEKTHVYIKHDFNALLVHVYSRIVYSVYKYFF